MSPLDKLLAEKKKSAPGSAKEEKKQAEDLRKKLNAKKAEEEDIEESDDEDDDSEDADDSDDDDANDFINDEADGKFLNFSPILCSITTVWKFQDFCITQILREINLEDSRSTKTAFLAILRANNFVHLVNFSLKKKIQKFINIKIKSLNM